MRVQVVNAGIIEDLTGYTLNLGWTSVRDPSKFGLDAFDDVDTTKGIFEIEYTSGMLTNIGPLNASLQLVPPGQGRPIESNNFKLTVKNSAINPEAIQGETSFKALENALVEVNGWNTRIDVVEQEFKDRADALDGAYPVRLTAAEQSVAAVEAQVDLLNRGLGETMPTMASLLAAYPTGDTRDHIVAGNIAEVDTLTVTGVPTTAGNVTVTLNGVAKTVAVDPAIQTTTALVATTIRAATFTGWTTGGTGAAVTFTATIVGTRTAPVFSGGATGTTGTFVRTAIGEAANFHRYFWNGTAWADGGAYQAIELINGSVTTEKISNTFLLPPKNIQIESQQINIVSGVVPATTYGSYISSNGQVLSGYNLAFTDYIPIEPNRVYRWFNASDINSGHTIPGSYYDNDKVYIGSISGTTAELTKKWTAPSNAYYIRINFSRNRESEFFINEYQEDKILLEWLGVGTDNIADYAITPSKLALEVSDLFRQKDIRIVGNDIEESSVIVDIFRYSNVTWGYYINASGTLTALVGVGTSDYIEVIEGNTYTWYNTTDTGTYYSYTGGWYDADKNWIMRTAANAAPQIDTAPTNARYVRITVSKSKYDLGEIYIKEGTLAKKLDWLKVDGDNIQDASISIGHLAFDLSTAIGSDGAAKSFLGMSANFLGDSITAGVGVTSTATDRYDNVLKTMLGLGTVRNYGISGNKIAEGAAETNGMSSRYSNMDNSADLIFVLGGTNDYGHSTATGGVTAPFWTFSDRTTKTFYGALHVLFKGLIAKYVGKKIIIMTPLPRSTDGQAGRTPNPDTGKNLLDYVHAIREVAEYYSLPILDLYSISGINPVVPEIKTAYVPDNLHPNSAGHAIMAKRIADWLDSNLKN